MSVFKDIISVVGMVIMAIVTIVNAVGVVFDIRDIRETTAIWGLTWSEVCFFIFAIAFWVVVIRLTMKVYKYEKARPSLWIRSKGCAILIDPRKQAMPRKIAWYFNVSIVNVSSKGVLGIRSIVLRLKYTSIVKDIRAFIGKPESDFANAPEGTMGGNHYLQPG